MRTSEPTKISPGHPLIWIDPRMAPISHRPPWLAFDQDDIDVMTTALDAAWNALRCNTSELVLPENAVATRALLARRIIAHARGGEMNYGRLLMHALDGLVSSDRYKSLERSPASPPSSSPIQAIAPR